MNKESEGNRLCKSCGACCKGYLFKQASLYSVEDIELVPEQNKVFAGEDGKMLMKLPCSKFDDICTIYSEKKPSICGDYQCRLLARLESGNIDLESAQDIAKNLLRYGDSISGGLQNKTSESIAADSLYEVLDKVFEEGMVVELKRKDPELLVDLTVFRFLRDKYFLD